MHDCISPGVIYCYGKGTPEGSLPKVPLCNPHDKEVGCSWPHFADEKTKVALTSFPLQVLHGRRIYCFSVWGFVWVVLFDGVAVGVV